MNPTILGFQAQGQTRPQTQKDPISLKPPNQGSGVVKVQGFGFRVSGSGF